MTDRQKFLAALAKASIGTAPVADQATHERVAQDTVAGHPDIAQRAFESGNYIPLIRKSQEAAPDLVEFWLAQRLGQIVRSIYAGGGTQ